MRVMLASLRTAGVGLNLTAADTVIMADRWWNRAVEAQAIDRVHRLGQTRPVCIYSLVCENTVEEQMIELQDSKCKMIEQALEGKPSKHRGAARERIQMVKKIILLGASTPVAPVGVAQRDLNAETIYVLSDSSI